MNRSLRLAGVLTLCAAFLLIASADGRAQGIAPEIEQCLQGTSRLSVVLLVDESASLQATDPDNYRVTGIKSVLAALNRLAEDDSSGKELDIEVLLAGFYGDAKPKPEQTVDGKRWSKVGPDTIKSLLAAAERYATANTGRDTDYAYALSNAKQLLGQRSAERARAGDQAPCDLVVFFTDGGYLVTDRGQPGSNLPVTLPYAPGIRLDRPGGGQAAMAAGRRLLCGPKGLIKQLGSEGTVLMTVALSADIKADDERFLKSLTAAGGDCGGKQSRRLGGYVETENSDHLFFRFNDSLAGRRGRTSPLRPCSGPRCEGGGNRFRAIRGEKGFQLLADTGADGLGIRFVTPTGKKVEIDSGADSVVEADGVRFRPLWVSAAVVQVDAEFDPGSDRWVGGWNVALNRPDASAGAALHSLIFRADMRAELVSEPILTRGAVNDVVFQLTSAAGEPATPGPLMRLIRPSATLIEPISGRPEALRLEGPDRSLRLASEIELALEESDSRAEIGLTMAFQGPPGHQIETIYQPFSFTTKIPDSLGYPMVEPAELALPSITGVGETSGEITVTGTAGDAGCVWLESADIAAPAEVGEIRLELEPDARDEASCIELAEGERRVIEVTARLDDEASGAVNAELTFGLKSSITPEVRATSIRASFPVAHQPNVAARILILIVLALLGAVLPVLILYLLNRAGATFTAPQSMQELRQSVEVDLVHGRVVPAGGADRVETDFTAFRPVSSSGVESRERSLAVSSLELRTIAAFSRSPKLVSLLQGPLGVVRSADAELVIAGAKVPLRQWEGHRWHEVPLDLPGTWIFEVTDLIREHDGLGELERVVGRLTLLINYGGSTDQGEALFDRAARALPDLDWGQIVPQDGATRRGSSSGDDLDRPPVRQSAPERAVWDEPDTPASSGDRFERSDPEPTASQFDDDDIWADDEPLFEEKP